MDWTKVAADFDWDGSWRDIYVIGTNAADWERVFVRLMEFEPRPLFFVDGEAQALPARVADVFSLRERGSPLLKVTVGEAVLHCHFFHGNDIEFDLDPSEIKGPGQADAVASFMRLLGEITGKSVILCHENMKEAVIARYSPLGEAVIWTGEQAGTG